MKIPFLADAGTERATPTGLVLDDAIRELHRSGCVIFRPIGRRWRLVAIESAGSPRARRCSIGHPALAAAIDLVGHYHRC